MRSIAFPSWLLLVIFPSLAACSAGGGSTSGGDNATVGGAPSTGGSGADSNAGGTTNSGGAGTGAVGATANSGGLVGSGGESPSGGSPGTSGGSVDTGGVATGGSMAAGGALAAGGGTTGSGGLESSGGDFAAGGEDGLGGAPSAAGGASSGGAATTGGAAGSSGTGGSADEICVWDEGPSASNGMMTCYWFAQGTSTDEQTCPGGYKTYCGYCGSEVGERPQGDGQQIWCPIYDVVSTVQNMSTAHFAALPPGVLGDNGQNCGMCVEVSYRNRTITATVIDSCPSCQSDEHIDVSLSAAEALGMNEIVGEVTSGVTWRVVGCPTDSDIQISFNGGYKGQVFFQNSPFPIASAVVGGDEGQKIVGFWSFSTEVAGQEVTLTDVMGHIVTATIPNEPGSLGVQFEQSCQ